MLAAQRLGSRRIAGIVASALASSTAAAQLVPGATRPAQSAPSPTTTNWWDTPAPGSAPRQEIQPAVAPQPNGSPYASHVLDFPSSMLSDWVIANTMAARAHAMLGRAESELNFTIRRVQQRFEKSKEFSDAVQAQEQAYLDYTTARQKVIASVGEDPKYRAISHLCDELGEKIADLRAHRDTEQAQYRASFHVSGDMRERVAAYDAARDRDEVLALATLKMQYAADARAIEVTALESDANLKSLRDKMVEASRRVAEMRARFDDSLHDNPEIAIARRNLEDARVAVVETSTLALSASVASDYAINYAYYLHRNDNGGYYGPYGANGVYGAGYYSPYWGR